MPTSARRPARRRSRFGARLLLLLPLGWPAAAWGDSAAESQVKQAASGIFQSCQSMASAHAQILVQANLMSNGGRQEGLETLADEAERIYLDTYQATISATTNQIARLEQDLRNLPPESQSVVPMEAVTGMCRLASEPVGAAGVTQLKLDMVSYSQAFASVRASASPRMAGRGGATSWPAGKEPVTAMPEPRLRPNEKPLTAAEYQERKEKWAARQQEEELRQQRELQLRQEALDASRQEKSAEPLPEAKVSVRTDLLPPSGPKMSAEQSALLPQMKGWHETYSDNVKPFKMALSQLMTVPASRAYARREACKSVWTAVDALNKTQVLKKSPDAAVAAPAVAMGAKFQQAVDACLMGNNRDMDRLMKEAEQELGKMAAALAAYQLSP